MKALILILGFVGISMAGVKDAPVESKVYSFSQTKPEATKFGSSRELINGSTTQMHEFEIHAITLNPEKTFEQSKSSLGFERIIVVKEGKIKVSLAGKNEDLSPGSVALLMPGDRCEVENTGLLPVTFYTIKYKSRRPADPAKGTASGGSVLLNWNDIQFTPHDKGGIRRYFDRKSAMSDRIEMHVTTLNPHLQSHPPHTHVPAEIILMMKGKTEMEIGGKPYSGMAGDVYFLESNVSHGIHNTGENPCMYLAFQFQ